MDITACLDRADAAFDEGDLEEAIAAYEDANEWVAKGGAVDFLDQLRMLALYECLTRSAAQA